MDLELDADLNDMQSVMDAGKTNNIPKLGDAFFNIMKKSYPSEPENEVRAFITKNIMSFLEEITIAWKFTTREAIDQEKLELKKKKIIES